MLLEEIVQKLGFDEDPFEAVAAENEPRLQQYFLQPDDYERVKGNPDKPRPFWVFAPRGGGKTAWRKMLEIESVDKNYLCVTYTRFAFPGSIQLSDITINYHVDNIIKRVLLGVLTALHEKPEARAILATLDKQFLRKLVLEYIEPTVQSELHDIVESLKNPSDKVKDFWKEHLDVLGFSLDVIAKQVGIGLELKTAESDPTKFPLDPSRKYRLENLISIAKKLGYVAVYVLIDRLDETDQTGDDAASAGMLIDPIAKDIDFQQLGSLGLKCFLWDEIKNHISLRTDKIDVLSLNWNHHQILAMLNRRLVAFSKGQVNRFSDIVDDQIEPYIEHLIAIFSMGTPRNTIRICKHILLKHQQLDSNLSKISRQSVIAGVDSFVNTIIVEGKEGASTKKWDDTMLRELRRIGRMTFTPNYVANSRLSIPIGEAEKRLARWVSLGLIVKVDHLRSIPGGSAIPSYAINNICIARHIYDRMDLIDFVDKKTWVCEIGGRTDLIIRDFDILDIYECPDGQQANWYPNWFSK